MVASFLQITNVLQHCCDFIRQTTSVDNCVKYAQLVCHYNLDIYEPTIMNFVNAYLIIPDDLMDFYNRNEHTELLYALLNAIVRNNDLLISELTLYQIVVDWLQADPGRAVYCSDLMKYIRFTTIPLKELQKLQKSPFVQGNPKIQGQIQDAENILSQKVSGKLNQEYLREEIRGGPSLCVFGGNYTRPTKSFSFQVLHSQEGKERAFEQSEWVRMPGVPHNFHYSAVTTMKDLIYVCGGWSYDDEGISDCYVFDPLFWRWDKIAPLSKPRCDFSLVTLEGALYAIGGKENLQEDTYCIETIERYCAEQNCWQKFIDLPDMAQNIAAVSLGSYIYFFNGPEGFNENPDMPSFFSFDSMKRGRGLPVSEDIMSEELVKPDMVAVADMVCIIPCGNPRNMSCYKPLTRQWYIIRDSGMISPEISGSSFLALGDKFFCVGCEKDNRRRGSCFSVTPHLVNDDNDEDEEEEAVYHFNNSYLEIVELPRLQGKVLTPNCAAVAIPRVSVVETHK